MSRLARVEDPAYLELADGLVLPLEQAPAWDRFDRAMPGREPWARLTFRRDDGELRALVSLARYTGRGFRYLWAKHGPVWVSPPTPQEERELRELLVAGVRRLDPTVVFVRLHARHRADDLRELLQTVPYDRTVLLDLTRTEEELLAGMKKRGRRDVRKALRETSLVVAEETGISREGFAELYDVLLETGRRDGFGVAPAQTYLTMLESLGPEHARLFVTRRERRPLAWGIVIVNDGRAAYYYGASSAEGRRALAADLLVWRMMTTLKADGARVLDLMGVDSDRAPSLAGVRDFKTKFNPETTEVDGAWDVPVHPLWYAALVRALAAKRWAVTVTGRARP